MKIKLIYPAQLFLRTETPRPDGSLGLLYIGAALRDAGHEVSLLDMCVGDADIALADSFYRRILINDGLVRVGIDDDALAQRLQGVDVVAVTSIFTMNTEQALDLARVAKRVNRHMLTIVGGGNARARHATFLAAGFDVVVLGEGETTIVELIDAWSHQRDLHDVKGIAYGNQQDEVVITEPRAAPTCLDELPIPAWDLLPLDRYWDLVDPPGGVFPHGERIRYVAMQTSRGCPFRCTYCHISTEGDAAKLRLKSDRRVMRELSAIQQLGADHVLLQDDSLLADRDRILRLFRRFKETGLGFSDTNGVNVSHFFRGGLKAPRLDDELLDAMREAGLGSMSIAFESGSRRIVDCYASKKWRPGVHDARLLIREAVARGFKVLGFFMIGYPDETLDELDMTFLLARDLVEAGLTQASFYIATPYPGTALFDYAQQHGYLPADIPWSTMKFQVPSMVNTTIPPEVLAYTRHLVFKLIHPAALVSGKNGKTIAPAGGHSNA